MPRECKCHAAGSMVSGFNLRSTLRPVSDAARGSFWVFAWRRIGGNLEKGGTENPKENWDIRGRETSAKKSSQIETSLRDASTLNDVLVKMGASREKMATFFVHSIRGNTCSDPNSFRSGRIRRFRSFVARICDPYAGEQLFRNSALPPCANELHECPRLQVSCSHPQVPWPRGVRGR